MTGDRYLSDLVLGSGMDEELANALLDDMVFFNNKVQCLTTVWR